MTQQTLPGEAIARDCGSCEISQTESCPHELGAFCVGHQTLLALKGPHGETDLLHPKKVEVCRGGKIQESGLNGVILPRAVGVHRSLGSVGVPDAVMLGGSTCILNRRAFM